MSSSPVTVQTRRDATRAESFALFRPSPTRRGPKSSAGTGSKYRKADDIGMISLESSGRIRSAFARKSLSDLRLS